jgi:hypothetical protein
MVCHGNFNNFAPGLSACTDGKQIVSVIQHVCLRALPDLQMTKNEHQWTQNQNKLQNPLGKTYCACNHT